MIMKASKPVAFVVLAFLIGGAASQLPFAFADSSANPLQSIWDAISALSNRQEDLQAQIDDLKASIESERVDSIQVEGPLSEASIALELEGGEQPSETLMHLIASNAGPDNAVGVKVTLFYEMPLFDIQSMNGEQCEDQSRGIIQCFIGTIGPSEEYTITITADAKSLDEESSIVVDISSITTDADQSNNHAELQFVTGDVVARIDDSEPLPIDEPEVSDDEQQQEPNESDTDSQNDEAEIVGNSTQDENIQSGTNSTQSSENEEPENQSADEEQQGSEDQTSSGQEENVNDNAEEETQDEASSESEGEGEQEEPSESDANDESSESSEEASQ
jgi:hypothetical protein